MHNATLVMTTTYPDGTIDTCIEMPGSDFVMRTAILEADPFQDATLADLPPWMLQAARNTLPRILGFVRQHSPGHDAVLDFSSGCVRWHDGYEHVSASTWREARNALGY